MLFEALKTLIVPAPRFLRVMGFLNEVIAIEARYRRCRGAWQNHLESCHAAVIDAAEQMLAQKGCPEGQKGRKVIVLGGALVYDLPMEFLSARFEEVVLVDLFHLPWVMRRLRGAGNIRFMMADVTGCLQDYHRVISAAGLGQRLDMPEKKPGLALDPDEVDLVLSVNLLSQLPAVPLGWAERRLGNSEVLPDADYDRFADHLVTSHLEWLRDSGVPVCLLTDTEKKHADRNGKDLGGEVMIERSLLKKYGFSEFRQWDWAIAPPGEISRKFSQTRQVVACMSAGGDSGSLRKT